MTNKNTIVLSCSRHFGEQLREIREQHGISQTALSIESGKDVSTLSKFEKNGKGWKVGRHNTYLYYCRALGRLLNWDDMQIVLTDCLTVSDTLPERAQNK